MKYFLTFLLCLSALGTPVQTAAKLESEVDTDNKILSKLQSRANIALDGAFQLAINELHLHGFHDDAQRIALEWDKYGRSYFVSNGRGIGDHPGISDWITEKYLRIEFLLGKDFCVRTHIASIFSLNHTIPVVFGVDCTGIDKAEYRRHFAIDDVNPGTTLAYHGLMMEVSWWSVYIGCGTLTAGTGYVLICGAASGVVEKVVEKFVAEGLSDRIYTKRCE